MRRATTAAMLLAVAACSGGDDGTPADERTAGTVRPAETSAMLADFTGRPEEGERLFAQCRTCHAIEPGANRTGPSLHGVVGREAGAVPGFAYSPALRDSDVIWGEDELFRYLESPQETVPGTRMVFAGIANPQDRADLIAYLAAQSQ